MSLRRAWPLLLSIVCGLGIAVFGAYQYQEYVQTHRETVKVIVASHNIMPYSVITPADLTEKQVVQGMEVPDAVVSADEAVGKIALTLLYGGEQIRRDKLGTKELHQDRQIVGVNINVARAAGGWLRPGDLVDVWWVPSGSQMEAPGAGWFLAAESAIVLDIRDSSGKSLFDHQQNSVIPNASQSAGPAVAVLAVKEDQVQRVVGGAAPNSQNVVLTLKFKEKELMKSAEEAGHQGSDLSNPGVNPGTGTGGTGTGN